MQDGIQGDTLSPIADGLLESCSCRNWLIPLDFTTRYLRLQHSLRNIPGSRPLEEATVKILMVLTSHDRMGDTGDETGFWLEDALKRRALATVQPQ